MMYLLRVRLLVGMTLLVSSLVNGQSSEIINDSIDRLLPADAGRIPGVSVAVVKDGQLIFSRSVGMANIKANAKNDSSTQFWIASVSKQFTAAAIYKLVLEKKILLDNSIRIYVPELPALFQNITVNHLIHHTSGIREGFVLTALSKKPPSSYTNDNVIHYLKASEDLNFLPGTRFEYNNSGYVILASIIERISGKTYASYMQENIFSPLGMKNSFVSPTFPVNEKQAQGYKENGPNQFEEYHFPGNTYGSTGIVTTLPDLVRWSQFLQQPGTVPKLAPIANYLLRTGQLRNGKSIAYGGGLEKFIYRGQSHFEHFGADEGFKADILYFPSTRLSVIGLTNNDSYYGLAGLLYKITDLVHKNNLRSQKVFDESKPPISEALYYNPDIPKFIRSQNFGDYARISSSPSAYSPIFQIVSDTLRSLDPIPIQYLQGDNFIQSIDRYYHNNYRLNRIQPNTQKDDLQKFTGQYYSKELQTEYKITAGEKGLRFEFVPGVVFDLNRLTDTDFMFDYIGTNYLQFSSNTLLFSREGCRKLKFEKR